MHTWFELKSEFDLFLPNQKYDDFLNPNIKVQKNKANQNGIYHTKEDFKFSDDCDKEFSIHLKKVMEYKDYANLHNQPKAYY